jgi:hypothetical protein
MKSRDLRSTFYELYSAVIMKMGGFEIRARPEVNVLRQDFDFEASRGREVINVEVTALTAPNFSANTVRNALIRKRRQLPDDRPSIIFCVIPRQWQENTDLSFWLHKVAFDFFASSKRINVIVFTWENYRVVSQREKVLSFPVVVVAHPAPRHLCDLMFLFETPVRNFGRYAECRNADDFYAIIRKRNFYRWIESLAM